MAASRGVSPLRMLAIVVTATLLDATLLAFGLGGFAALGEHPRALALLGVWTVGNAAIALVRPKLVKPASAERESPPVLLALFVLPFAAAPLAAWGERAGILPLAGVPALHWAALALVALGLALRASAMAWLGARFSHLVVLQSSHELETGGPYSLMRHPGYLGALIASTGAALVFKSFLGLVPVAFLIPALRARVAREDRMLEARFGDAFRAWRERTGALFPRLGR